MKTSQLFNMFHKIILQSNSKIMQPIDFLYISERRRGTHKVPGTATQPGGHTTAQWTEPFCVHWRSYQNHTDYAE